VYVPLEELKAMDRERWLALVRGGLYAEIDVPAFRRNVLHALGRIIDSHRGERVAVVCHGGVINAFAGDVLDVREPFMFLDAGYASISRFLIAGSGERSVASLNETGHLRG
jgi:probable phosphoglycerate mutase